MLDRQAFQPFLRTRIGLYMLCQAHLHGVLAPSAQFSYQSKMFLLPSPMYPCLKMNVVPRTYGRSRLALPLVVDQTCIQSMKQLEYVNLKVNG